MITSLPVMVRNIIRASNIYNRLFNLFDPPRFSRSRCSSLFQSHLTPSRFNASINLSDRLISHAIRSLRLACSGASTLNPSGALPYPICATSSNIDAVKPAMGLVPDDSRPVANECIRTLVGPQGMSWNVWYSVGFICGGGGPAYFSSCSLNCVEFSGAIPLVTASGR